MSIKLKPCPFCGKEMTLLSSRVKRVSVKRAFIFSHKGLRNCAFYNFEISWETAKSLDEAIALWNRRANNENLS